MKPNWTGKVSTFSHSIFYVVRVFACRGGALDVPDSGPNSGDRADDTVASHRCWGLIHPLTLNDGSITMDFGWREHECCVVPNSRNCGCLIRCSWVN